MRTPLLALAFVMGLLAIPAVPAVAAAAADMAAGTAALAAQQPPQIDVDVNQGGAWYADPVWIAIGVIALVVLILLIAMATRRSGTTVIRE